MYDTLRLRDVVFWFTFGLSFTHVWNLDVTSGIVPVTGTWFCATFWCDRLIGSYWELGTLVGMANNTPNNLISNPQRQHL